MNVGYKELNCADVGRGLKLDRLKLITLEKI